MERETKNNREEKEEEEGEIESHSVTVRYKNS